jgi:hypothetical protein
MQGMPISPVAEIEARQDEVLRLLDELNQRIEWALFELGVASPQPSRQDPQTRPADGT